MKITRELWISTIATALGERTGTDQSRRQFAERLIGKLASALPAGMQKETVRRDLERLRVAIDEARRTTGRLQEITKGSQPTVLDLHSRALWRTTRKRFKRDPEVREEEYSRSYGVYLAHLAQLTAEALRKAPLRRRGPKNDLAITIAETIALEYHHAFGRLPGKVKPASAVTPNPYNRVCNAVDQLLLQLRGRRPGLSWKSRQEGIARARERLQTPP